MGRRGAKPKEATPPASQQEKRNPIQWSGNLDVALAHIMKENWASYQGSKNKMEVCRKWAAILHISQQDTGGEKTKAHISHLVSSYTKARELLQMTGSGSKVKEVKVNGKKMKVTVSVEDQVRQICPVYEILDTFLGTRATVVMSSTIGLGTNGLMGTLTLGGKKDEAGGDISSASEDSTNLPKSTNIGMMGPLNCRKRSTSSSGNIPKLNALVLFSPNGRCQARRHIPPPTIHLLLPHPLLIRQKTHHPQIQNLKMTNHRYWTPPSSPLTPLPPLPIPVPHSQHYP
ncbi:hypothetical protein BDZ91DRAFT_708744 [Kalaharituber pfeilii]|nr:hypothetical protein BDZ91DRAFT_708744 [Kalaharituber pfeilii]